MRCTLAKGTGKAGHCEWCNKPLTGRRRRWCSDPCGRAWWTNHVYSAARKAAKRRDHYQCVQCGSKEKLEVNHIKPANGKHSKKSCIHHQENLETLCHDCHLIVTAHQRHLGLFDKPKRAAKKR